jgi:hypothetical protein
MHSVTSSYIVSYMVENGTIRSVSGDQGGREHERGEGEEGWEGGRQPGRRGREKGGREAAGEGMYCHVQIKNYTHVYLCNLYLSIYQSISL